MKSWTYSKSQHIAISVRHTIGLSLPQWSVAALLDSVFLLISQTKSYIKWLDLHFTRDSCVDIGPRKLPLVLFSSPQCLLLVDKIRRGKLEGRGYCVYQPRMICGLLSIILNTGMKTSWENNRTASENLFAHQLQILESTLAKLTFKSLSLSVHCTSSMAIKLVKREMLAEPCVSIILCGLSHENRLS
ncbi:rCG62970 [Rattus norvegicus]|uniref:RCG62970 n=1 Tax=Rattus norvegicus TaxID=10116 RepID=A6HQI3_RAT|nr:rCG62970 [Rattus norvegicus]